MFLVYSSRLVGESAVPVGTVPVTAFKFKF